MTEVTWAGGSRSVAPQGSGPSSTNLADLLERILDKGLVIVGDIRVNLLDIELLTIKLRLIVASVDTARRMGIDWLEDENRALRDRLTRLERQLEAGSSAKKEGDG